MVLTIKLSMKYMKYKVVADHLTENKSKVDLMMIKLIFLFWSQDKRGDKWTQIQWGLIHLLQVSDLLGGQVHQDMRVVEHLLDSDANLV